MRIQGVFGLPQDGRGCQSVREDPVEMRLVLGILKGGLGPRRVRLVVEPHRSWVSRERGPAAALGGGV